MTQNSIKNVICGEKYEFNEYTKGLGEFFFEHGKKFNKNICQINARSSEKETYGNIIERSTRMAVNLKKMGVTSKDMITICSNNTMDNCIPFFAGLFLGAKLSAVYHKQSIREWMHCLNLCQPSFIFVEESCIDNMEKCLKDLNCKPEVIVFGKSNKYKCFNNLMEISADEAKFCPFEVKNNTETALVLFSSGTTGPPKGMCLSHYGLINRTITKMHPKATQGVPLVGLTYSTLYWISSTIHLITCFQTGETKIIPPPEYDATEMLEIIDKYKVNYIYTNPVLLRPLFTLKDTKKFDTSSLMFLTTIGASLHKSEASLLGKIFKNAFISQAYATSETLTGGTDCWYYQDKKSLHKSESVGKVTPFCEIKIVDTDTRNILGPNQPGEIYIKTSFGFSGYYQEDSSKYFDIDGFFKTGDLAYYDKDECFYIVGRLKETFKYCSYHIPPVYLESILQEHPDVLYAGVFGIPDEQNGHLPAACVVLKDKATSAVNEIEQYFIENVSDWFKLRGGIKIVSELPMTPSFKIQRNKLLELFLTS